MASQIYSRYIPPKKKIKLTSKSILLSNVPIETPAVPIPPPPPPESESKSDPQPILDTEAPPKRKRKHETQEEAKPKNSKKREASDVDDGEEPKPKKSKKRNESTNEDAEDEDRKHKKLMEKRQKSLKKAEKLAKKAAKKAAKEGAETNEEPSIEEPAELHGLGPLPQPDPAPKLPSQSASSSLPQWLANPIRVAPTENKTFSNLGVDTCTAAYLEKHGFKQATAIQTAVLPELHHTPPWDGDVVIEAGTGSGKTFAYALPMVKDVSTRLIRLQAVIIVPTRELVEQVRNVVELCIAGGPRFQETDKEDDPPRVPVGTAVGNVNFSTEQAALVGEQLRYDPEGYQQLERRLNTKWESSDWESDREEDIRLCDDEELPSLPDHTIEHISRVSILVCTPGRLVEHLNNTPGFTLKHVKWLIVDEADRLLDQSFQQWLPTVLDRLGDRPIQKVIVSATIPRNTGVINSLKLWRPRLWVLESSNQAEGSNEGYAIPEGLSEAGIRIDDESQKPLELLNHLEIQLEGRTPRQSLTAPDESDDDSESSESSVTKSKPAKKITQSSKSEDLHGVLIFTGSNENAVRLARLIFLLNPKYEGQIGTLTSTIRSKTRKATILSFNTRKLSILVASDLVARGLDLSNLALVINYDVPSSIESYIHRVGRTARAGKKGHALTLYTHKQARWFRKEVANSELIHRPESSKFKIIKGSEFSEEEMKKYESALASLGQEATGLAQ